MEMEMMFLKYSGETMALREEIERLREENQQQNKVIEFYSKKSVNNK